MWSEKKPNGKYIFRERYTDPMTGKQKIVSVTLDRNTAASRKKAEQALLSRILSKTSGSEPSGITLGALSNIYLDHKTRTTRPNTYQRDRYVLAAINRILGSDILVSKLQAGYIRQRFEAVDETPGWKNEKLRRLKAFLRWAYKNDYIDDISFLMKLDLFPDASRRAKIEDKYLESSELRALLDTMSVEKWRDLTEFLALSGLRIGEAFALTIDDVDLDARLIQINKTCYLRTGEIQLAPKTHASNRQVYIQEELLPLTRRLRKSTLPYCLVNKSSRFFQDDNGPYDYDAYRKYLRENSERVIGRKLTPHALRHTHTSLLAEQGVGLETISRRLGHADSGVTKDIYFHVTDKMREKDYAEIKDVKIL